MSSFRERIFLIGYMKRQMTESKLPSIYGVAKLNLNGSATLVILEKSES